MQYTNFKYIYPPRPENKILPDTLERYNNGFYIAQVKYNGSNTPVFLGDTKPLIYNRHRELTSPSKLGRTTIDFKGMHRSKGYMVIAGELMNKAKTGEDGKLLTGYVMWDILVHDGIYLVGKTLEQRLELLESLYPAQQQQHTHLITTDIEGVYRAPYYTHYFDELYNQVVKVDAYEGLVLKKATAKLDYGFNQKNNYSWQVKCRKATKNYSF